MKPHRPQNASEQTSPNGLSSVYAADRTGGACAFKVGDIMKVRNLQNDDIAFVSDSQDVEAIKNNVPESMRIYDSYFVVIGNGEYQRLYGMFGIVPWQANTIYQLIS